jgi:pimeloyl-ACP methyl ester carboxylesterase
MHPRDDAMAPTESGRAAAAAFVLRATSVEVPQCGHAFLPEQPDAIAANLIAFLRAHPRR